MNKQTNKPDEDPVSKNKCVLLIIDGLGDLPNPVLDGKTPLEAAYTPVLDRLAGSGWYGLVDPISPGKIPNTHSGTGTLMGLLPEQTEHLTRGPVEAAGIGRPTTAGDVAVRANFATIERRDEEFLVTDRRAGRITTGTDELAALLKDVDLGDGISASLFPTNQHRGVLILSGPGLVASVSDTDPGDIDMPAAMKSCRALEPRAELTAEKINCFVAESFRRLEDHPLNIARVQAGKLPASGILTRGAGSMSSLDNMMQSQGVRAAVVAGCNTVLGLGRMLGFNAISHPHFTATVETDIHAKIKAVGSALQEHDLVFVHFKAPDICSHDRQPQAKRDFLQRLDRALEPLLETGTIIAVGADHTTDSNTGHHSADPVPVLISQPDSVQSAEPVKFGEATCKQGNMDRQLSNEFLSRILHKMGFSPG